MAWVRFIAPYNFTPPEDRRTAVKYAAGYEGNVRRACAEAAVAAGAAKRIKTPSRGETLNAGSRSTRHARHVPAAGTGR